MQVIKNYQLLAEGLKKGIETRQCYQGFFNRTQGRVRSVLAQKFLQKIAPDDHAALLALLWAIFKPDAFQIFSVAIFTNRSTVLANLIAEQLITGNEQIGTDYYINTLESKVFSDIAFRLATSEHDNDGYAAEGAGASFDKRRGVRWLLKKAVEALEPNQRQEVIMSANKIAVILDSSNEEAEIKDDILPPRQLTHNLVNLGVK